VGAGLVGFCLESGLFMSAVFVFYEYIYCCDYFCEDIPEEFEGVIKYYFEEKFEESSEMFFIFLFHLDYIC